MDKSHPSYPDSDGQATNPAQIVITYGSRSSVTNGAGQTPGHANAPERRACGSARLFGSTPVMEITCQLVMPLCDLGSAI